MAKFQCNDCGNNFSGDSLTDECPKCQSIDIERKKTGKSGFFKKYKWFIIAIPVIILILILVFSKKNETKATHEKQNALYDIKFKPHDDNVEILVYEHLLDNDSVVTGKFNLLNETDAERVLISLNFEAMDAQDRIVTKQKTHLYPCLAEDTLTFKFRNSTRYPLKNKNAITKTLYFSRVSKHPNKEANCYYPLQILEVKILNNCQIEIITNKDTLPTEKDEIYFSINGKHGDYQKAKRIWAANGIDTINVYAALNTDTVAAFANGDPFTGIGCVSCTENDRIRRKHSIIALGNKYGENPTNRANMANFFNSIIGNPDYYVNGQKIGKKPNFQSHVYNQYQNKLIKFKILDHKLLIDQTSCSVIKIEIEEYE